MWKESQGRIEPTRDEIPPFFMSTSKIVRQATELKICAMGLMRSYIIRQVLQKGGE